MEMNVKDNRIFRVTTDIESHNKGTLCAGGRFGFDLVHHEDRLVSPLLRRDGELKPASWEDALVFVADRLKGIILDSGPESVAGLASPRLTNEDCYAFQKLFRAIIGTNNIDSEARFSLGPKGPERLVLGAQAAEEFLKQRHARNRSRLWKNTAWGGRLRRAGYDSNVIVANSRKTSLEKFARVQLRISPYSESDLILGIMKIILDLDLWDSKFVRDRTVNFLPMKNLLDKISLKGILRREQEFRVRPLRKRHGFLAKPQKHP
jgi:predicted molibdopterin-dependent oxidoreductase YjgC